MKTWIRVGKPSGYPAIVEPLDANVVLVEYMTDPPCHRYTGSHIQPGPMIDAVMTAPGTLWMREDRVKGGWTRCDTCNWPHRAHTT
jgi:hypothetical protein